MEGGQQPSGEGGAQGIAGEKGLCPSEQMGRPMWNEGPGGQVKAGSVGGEAGKGAGEPCRSHRPRSRLRFLLRAAEHLGSFGGIMVVGCFKRASEKMVLCFP